MNEPIRIAEREVGDGCQPYIVAEIGQNHNGDVYTATRLVGMAQQCGCDAVKFQLRDAPSEYTPEALAAPHPRPHHAHGDTYGAHRQALDLGEQELRHISTRIQYNEWPIKWFATPCYFGAVEILYRLGCPAFKIASKDICNLDLIREAASTGKPVIISTGMAGLPEIERALHAVGDTPVIVLQCTSQYPCDDHNAELGAMLEIAQVFDVPVGFSDHTVGILAAPLAVAMGACLIEKHITLARAQPGSDHAAACEADGLRRLVRDCRRVAPLMGSRHKMALPASNAAADKLQPVVVAAREIEAGEELSRDNLALRSTGGHEEYAIRSIDDAVGLVTNCRFNPNDVVRRHDIM